ncbi:hypothetical protein ACGFJ7_21095 [Actinoplanes sp. NPDC048988]|uniref:hypothetical protein n=1 Tax=Actinoplanes sp. NPDC048988 TaxID=3363901 RepID=UPI0037169B62
MELAEIALLAAAAVHLGFQVTVTAVAYPALARVPPDQWGPAHRAHTRAITPVVVVVYGSLVVTGGWVLWSGPRVGAWVALAATAVALLATALAAAPAHGRLAGGRDPLVWRRLLRADLVRTLAAAVAVAALMTVR